MYATLLKYLRQLKVPRLSKDANNNTVLVGADGVIDNLNLKPLATLDGRFLDGQPYGITRPVLNTGKLVCRFKASEMTAFGSAVLADHTGYDANGDVTGIVSRTGHPSMLKITPADDANEGAKVTTFAGTVFNATLAGHFGLWVYIETQPGYDTGGGAATLNVDLSTTTAFTNYMSVAFAPNCLKEGWNFLVFRMRNFQAYVAASGVSETHPHGVIAKSIGDGSTANILASPIAGLRITLTGTGITGTNFYLDSMWTGFETQAQIVMGYDTTGASITDYAIPLFEQYGWKGYVTINGNYWDGVESRIWDNYTFNTGDYPTHVAAVANAGWDTINHGLQHLPGSAASSLPKMSDLTDAAEIAYEVMANYGCMASLGLTRGLEFYAPPRNSMSRLAQKVIAGCGFKLQRAARGKHFAVTPWGVANPHYLGSLGLGATDEAVYQETLSNVSAEVKFGAGGIGNLQKAKNAVDLAEDYGATLITYAHGLETADDDGTGDTLPAESTNCIESLNRLFMEYVKQKEDAGMLRVCDGFTGFYYGVGR